jgi:hypothetical protein
MTDERTTCSVWRLFWAWEDDRQERWLTDMARRGWHLRRAALMRFTFDRGEPSDVVYKLDYTILKGGERDEYLGLFRAAGWEHVGEVANWHFFRTLAAAGADPDIFSDDESRAAKYKRLLVLLVALLPIVVMSFARLLQRPRPTVPGLIEWLLAGGTVAYALLLVLWLYALVRIALKIRRIGGRRSR